MIGAVRFVFGDQGYVAVLNDDLTWSVENAPPILLRILNVLYGPPIGFPHAIGPVGYYMLVALVQGFDGELLSYEREEGVEGRIH